jgi:hypothetical protein
MATQIKLRRDSAANWASANPVLGLGEPGYDTSNSKLKVGDGSTAWNSLPWVSSLDYNDLTNTPAIPSDISDLSDNNNLLNSGGVSVSAFGEGFSLDNSDKIVTNKLYSTNQTNSNQHYRLTLDTNGVVVLPDQSIINGATLRVVPGTGELNYAALAAGPDNSHPEQTWIWADATGAWVQTNSYVSDSIKWHFDNDGHLVFPAGSEHYDLGAGNSILSHNIDVNGHVWAFDATGNLTIPATGDITRDGVSAFASSGGAGGIFETTYTYQAGTYLTSTTAAEPGNFATANDEDSTSDLVQDTKLMLLGPVDANGKDNSTVFNWLVDAGVGAQIRVTDPQGNQVARLVTTSNIWPDTTESVYNGYRVHITRMYGNNTPSKSKIFIVADGHFNSFDADYTADTDFARWYMTNEPTPILLSLYAEQDELPMDMTQLWNFATSIVDTITPLETVSEKQAAFYSQIDTLIANAFPPGTLYKDFEFYNNGSPALYPEVDGRVTYNTSSGTGSYFQISWDESHYWVSRDNSRVYDGGNGYAVNDTIVVLGSYFNGGEDGTNDLTLTVTEVNIDGEIKRWTITGTPPTATWPTDSVANGGSSQEYYANKFFTEITGNNANQGHNRAAAPGATLQAVPYNNGQVTSGEGIFFGSGTGEYAVVYKSSVLGLFVTGNACSYIETDGDSGSNSGHLDDQWNPHWLSYGLGLRVVEGSGSWTPGTKYTFTFDFNNATGRILFSGHNIYSEPGQDIWLGNYGGEGYVYIPQDQNLGNSYVEIGNWGHTNAQGVYNNSGIGLNINNGSWRFRQDINNAENTSASNNLYIQNPNNTRTVSPDNVNCAPNVDTVVYTATADYVSSIKLFLMAEGSPDGAPQDWSQYWDTQSTDAIVVATPNPDNPNYLLPAITVYGRVYTGAAPVATFSVRRNLTTNRLEVLARPTATTYFCYVRATVTEIMTQD